MPCNLQAYHLCLKNKVLLGAQGGQAIADALKVNQSLQHLDLPENLIGAQGVQAIADALKVNQSLQHIDV